MLGARYANWTAIPPVAKIRANRRRLDSIVNVSNADAVVCTKGNSHRVQTLTRTNLKLCIVDELTDARPEDTFDTSVDTPAIVQFTSGSTRAPKGVVLKDSHALANLRAMHAAVELNEACQLCDLVATFSRHGISGHHLHALYANARLVISTRPHSSLVRTLVTSNIRIRSRLLWWAQLRLRPLCFAHRRGVGRRLDLSMWKEAQRRRTGSS